MKNIHPAKIILDAVVNMDAPDTNVEIVLWAKEYFNDWVDDNILEWCQGMLEKHYAIPDPDSTEVADFLIGSNPVAAERWMDEMLMRLPADVRKYLKEHA